MVFWPQTPPALTDEQVLERLEHPVAQPPIRRLAAGKARPVVIVDDLTRPTPVARVMPFLLREFRQAGIAAGEVTIILAKGAHGLPPADAMAKKVGTEAASSCRLLLHDYTRDLVRLGRTSFGTPVLVNRAVAASDFLVGVGGIYPQHSTGFGGGSKLALGVLGKRSIMGLHYGHRSMEGSYEIENTFRRDLDEIARMIGLHCMVSLHVDADREVVRMVSGDHQVYYRDAVAFSRQAYLAPLPGAADVIVSNAYPMDVSLTFMRSKGLTPLYHAAAAATRIVVSASPEGIGHHGLFPFLDAPRFQGQIHRARRMRVIGARAALPKIAARVVRRLTTKVPPRGPLRTRRPIWLYPPDKPAGSLPPVAELWEGSPERLATLYAWPDLLDRVRQEQGDGKALRVVVYPCAPLQVLDLRAATRDGGIEFGAGE